MVSDKADAPAIARRWQAVFRAVVQRRDYASRAEFEMALAGWLKRPGRT